MPTYKFYDTKRKKHFEQMMTYEEAKDFTTQMPWINFIGGAPMIGDPVLQGRVKPDNAWRQHLRAMKKANPGSTINDFGTGPSEI